MQTDMSCTHDYSINVHSREQPVHDNDLLIMRNIIGHQMPTSTVMRRSNVHTSCHKSMASAKLITLTVTFSMLFMPIWFEKTVCNYGSVIFIRFDKFNCPFNKYSINMLFTCIDNRLLINSPGVLLNQKFIIPLCSLMLLSSVTKQPH